MLINYCYSMNYDKVTALCDIEKTGCGQREERKPESVT
jgi:hypothetical protein